MENLFFIEYKLTKDYPILVYSLGYHQISEYIKPLENILKEESYSGIVLFDLLLYNGLNNRFFSMEFYGDKFDYKSGKHVPKLPSIIVKKANKYLSQNKTRIENSILSKSEKIRFVKQNHFALNGI